MTDTPIAATEGGLNTDRELWREREGDYYANSIHVTESGGIGINVGGTVIVKPLSDWHALATRTPSPCSLGEDVVERVARALAGKHGIRSWDDLCPRGFFCTPRFIGKDYWFEQAETALSALRPDVGEDVVEARNAALDAAAREAHKAIVERAFRGDKPSPGDCSAAAYHAILALKSSALRPVQEEGVGEELRALSEKATQGEWFQGRGCDDPDWNGDSESQHKIWPDPYGVGGIIARTGPNFTGWIERHAADAAFIVACVNHVRAKIASHFDASPLSED